MSINIINTICWFIQVKIYSQESQLWKIDYKKKIKSSKYPISTFCLKLKSVLKPFFVSKSRLASFRVFSDAICKQMQAMNVHCFNWPSRTLVGGCAPGRENTQGFDVLFPFVMVLQDRKIISSPVLERTERTHCSNPQIFNTSNLLSANLSTWHLSSPRFPKHFICSRVTCPTTIRFQIIHTAPQAGGLGSSSPPRRAPPGDRWLITTQVNKLTLSLANPWVSRSFLEGTARRGPYHQKTLLCRSSKKLITTKLWAFNPINKTHQYIIIILGT